MTHHQRLLLKLWRAPRLHEVDAPLESRGDVGARGRGCVCVCVSACDRGYVCVSAGDRVKQMCESVSEIDAALERRDDVGAIDAGERTWSCERFV